MSDHRTRIMAIRALLAGSHEISSSSRYTEIMAELDETFRTRRVRVHRRKRLLQVLHSTRALDSSLQTFTSYHNVGSGKSLGGYLRALERHTSRSLRSQLSPVARHRFQQTIVNVRNTYMHEAGAYPLNDTGIRSLLSEMQDCLLAVLSL